MAALASGGTAIAADPPIVASAPAAQEAVAIRPLALKRTLFKLKEGQVWEHWGSPLACDLIHSNVRWQAGRFDGDVDRLSAVFTEELAKAGLKSSEANDLFTEDSPSESLLLGAVVKDMHVKMCGLWNDSAAELLYRASATMTVEWQVFDPVRREVIGRIETTAGAEDNKRSKDGLALIVVAAFRQNASSLMGNDEFRRIVAVRKDAPREAKTGKDKNPIFLMLEKNTKTPLSEAQGSVVTVTTADGHGSGFLISPDGYLITNQHVVGASTTVRIRWSDGFEDTGEVIRSDKRRDVALIKAGAHSRQPLNLRMNAIHTGDTVFAIGTPLKKQFQGTLTRGVVSSFRLIDGLNFLQSDAVVNPGNSGGPLIDENGQVVAITVSVYRPDDTPTGINFFIPIGDALDFLNLKPAPMTAAR
jgi:serine protease Do